jgi:hypothetical protein
MNTLDLHNTYHTEVTSIVTNFIEDNLFLHDTCIIITGNSDLMKQKVIQVLELYSLQYVIEDKLNPANTGCITVTIDY